MPLGPKRAPGRYDVPVSKGAPEKLMRLCFLVFFEGCATYERNIECLLLVD